MRRVIRLAISRTATVRLALTGLMLGLAIAGCSGSGGDETTADGAEPPSVPSSLPVLSLAEQPSLEIGELVGEGDQALDYVEDVTPLPDGTLAVLDRGASRVLVYDQASRRVRQFGGSGDGPGEFRRPGRILLSGDSLFIVDEGDRSVSTMSLDGSYRGEMRGAEFTGDDQFDTHILFHDRFWLDGALDPEERTRVTAILDRLDYPIQQTGVRYARTTSDGGLWIREQWNVEGSPDRWMIVSPSAEPTAFVEIPGSFDPLWLSPDEVIGRWIGELDVNYVRRYELEPTGRSSAVPDWVLAQSAGAPPAGEVRDSLFRLLKRGAVTGAISQEAHYAEHRRYTMSIDDAVEVAGTEVPEGVTIDMFAADDLGHGMFVTTPGLDGFCGLVYGNARLGGGLIGGAVTCGR